MPNARALNGTASARRVLAALLLAGTALAGCTPRTVEVKPVVPPLPPLNADAGRASARVSGPVLTQETIPQVAVSTVRGAVPREGGVGAEGGQGSFTYGFVDADIREVVADILGRDLRVNYTIDPAVHGTATLRTVTPLSANQLLPVLQSLLAQNGATLTAQHGVYRVLPVAAAAGVAGGAGIAGGTMVPLRYAAAEDLAKSLTPFAQGGARIIAVPGANAVVLSGEPAQRDALADLVRSFDIDTLAGQSYALLPVTNGDAGDMADALKQAFRAQSGGALASQVRVVPLPRVNAVLIIANAPGYITEARRTFEVIERGRRQTTRSWHVYYLQNGTANDVAYVLQEAFTPGNVTAQPSARATGQQSQSTGLQSSFGSNSSSGGSGLGGLSGGGSSGGIGGGGLGGSSSGGGLGGGLGGGTTGSGGQGTPVTGGGATGSNPLLGGITNSAGGGGQAEANAMRIIPNPDNNALLVYATGAEEDTVEAMLHKIDILPLQVRIDAIIAEVTLNDNLNYGTQFYFRHHSINGGLSNQSLTQTFASAASSVAALPQTALPAFVFNAAGKDGDIVLQALQDVTTVKVLSAPELLVLDNETASLQVGNQVPIQTGQLSTTAGTGIGTATSTSYVNTGVITQVTPRVNSSGLVTLDIMQEVSSVVPQTDVSSQSGSGINSPTFSDRQVKSRIVIQDGQTVGLAGLITDNVTRGNTGIPFLKDVPLLGLIGGTQTNTRTRTELLILLTPHVLRDQREARALTEDLRETLPRAAAMPYELQNLKQQGATDPQAGLRRSLGLTPQ